MFSDYSGDVGTIYNVASESKVVGEMKYIPTPGASGVGSNLGNPDGIGIPAEAKHVAAAVAFMKWMEEPANQAAFAGADGPKDVIQTFPLPSNRGGLADLVKSKQGPRRRDPADAARATTRSRSSRPARRRGTRSSQTRCTPTSTRPPPAASRWPRRSARSPRR